MASDIVVKVGADASEFNDAIEQARKKASTLSDSLATIAKVSGVAFGSIVADATHAILSFKESEEVSKNLALALRNQGLDADKLSQKYDKLAQAVSEKTKFDDDQVKSGFAVLQSFIGQQEIGDELATTLLDLAAKSGSVEGAAQDLGRAFQGNTRGLKQYGIVVDQTLSLSERQAAVIKAVKGNFDGLAESQGKGLGSLDRLKKAFDDIQKALGQRLAPVVEEAANFFTDLFNAIKNNGPLLDVIVYLGKAAFIITGLITAVAAASAAWVAFTSALTIVLPVLSAIGAAITGVVGATGIGLLIVAAGLVYAYWDKIFPAMKAIIITFVNDAASIFGGFGTLLRGVFTLDTKAIQDGLAEIKGSFIKNFKEIEAAASKTKTSPGAEESGGADKAQVKAARERAAELKRVDEAQLESKQAHYDAQLAAQQGFSDATVKLIEEESATLKALAETSSAEEIAILEDKLSRIEALETQAIDDDIERQKTYYDTILANNAEYQALDDQSKADFRARQDAAQIASLTTTRAAKQKALADDLKIQIDANNQYLADQQKFGAAYAAINSVVYSHQVQQAEKGFSELSQLQQSNNVVLKTIGKAAAVTDITIKTAQSAMNIFNAFSVIPFVGIPLGIAGAAAAVAFGAEQIGKVVSAQSGGIVPGFNNGGDSIPSILQPGELVVPRQNFSQVVQAVAARQVQEDADLNVAQPTPSPASSGSQAITIGFDGGEAEKVLTARRVEARSLGTLREARV